MRRFTASHLVPSRFLPSAIAVALVAGLIVAAPPAAPPAEASIEWDAAIDITFPVAGPVSFQDDYTGGRSNGRYHRATDIMAPEGASVHAAMGGTIGHISGIGSSVPNGGYMIRIDGDDGRAYWYIHLGRQNRGPGDAYAPGMQRGLRVERGQWIGINGCSGNASCSAPHLHFEIHDDVNEPAKYRPDGDDRTRMNPHRSLVAARNRGDIPTGTGVFQDVRVTNTHVNDIEWLAAQGVTRGCNPPANTRFCPAAGVTREQMAAFMVRSLNLKATSGVRFRDVPRGSTFERDIDRLATAGVTRGCNPPANDRFCPKDVVTREQMAAFLSRGYKLPSANVSFRDVSGNSSFAGDIGRLANAGITRGCNPPANDRFCPSSPVTRAQLASFLYRAR